MIKFDTFYMQCPCCKSWLEGHIVRSEMINKSVLYSDGKILNDNYITELQKVVICPACSHYFWVNEYSEPLVTKVKPSRKSFRIAKLTASLTAFSFVIPDRTLLFTRST